MSIWIITVTGTVLITGYLWYRGNMRLNALKNLEMKLAEELREDNGNMMIMGACTYHGGLPKMPKPVNAKLALFDECIMLYSLKGSNDRVYYSQIKKVYSFTTCTKADTKNQSFVFWGPLIAFMFKDKIKHFIVINYLDIDNEENNILLETRLLSEAKEMCDRIRSARRKSRWGEQNEAKLLARAK